MHVYTKEIEDDNMGRGVREGKYARRGRVRGEGGGDAGF